MDQVAKKTNTMREIFKKASRREASVK